MSAIFLTCLVLLFGLPFLWFFGFRHLSLRSNIAHITFIICGALWYNHAIEHVISTPADFIFDFRTPLSKVLTAVINVITEMIYGDGADFLGYILYPVRWLGHHGLGHMPAVIFVLLFVIASMYASFCFLLAFIVCFPELHLLVFLIIRRLDQREDDAFFSRWKSSGEWKDDQDF